jgi:hypothetical protein
MELIKKQGGEVVATPTVPGCLVVSGTKRTLVLKNIIEKGEQDVIDFRYFPNLLNLIRTLSFEIVI